jgi:hypothetical protein
VYLLLLLLLLQQLSLLLQHVADARHVVRKFRLSDDTKDCPPQALSRLEMCCHLQSSVGTSRANH